MTTRKWHRGLCVVISLALCALTPTSAWAESQPQYPLSTTDTSNAVPQSTGASTQASAAGKGQSHDSYDDGRGKGGGSNWLIPALIVGAVALFAINKHLNTEKTEQRDEHEGMRQLLRDGPQMPTQFNASAFGIRAPVRSGWPIVVDYAQHKPGRVLLRISVPGAEIVTYRLDQFGLGRHLLRFDLPPFLGDSVRPAVFALTAADEQTGTETIEGFTVYGIGCGPRAVGSIAVDQLEFNPGEVRVQNGDTASFAFHSKSDFDNSAVEYLRITQSPDGARKRYVNGQRIGSVRRGSRVEAAPTQRWNGQDEQARTSRGRHQLQVRVWDDGGDWIGAWSDSLVQVR